MKRPKKEHPVAKEARETAEAMSEGIPATGTFVVMSQLERAVRVAFQLGGEYALRNPELAKEYFAKQQRKELRRKRR